MTNLSPVNGKVGRFPAFLRLFLYVGVRGKGNFAGSPIDFLHPLVNQYGIETLAGASPFSREYREDKEKFLSAAASRQV